MFISQATFMELVAARAKAEQEARTLGEQNKAWQVTNDWFRMRLTQLETQYAQMLFNYTGVKVPVPEVLKAAVPAVTPLEEASITKLLQQVGFNDIGDAEAHRLGVGWEADGTLKTTTE